jgi:DNA-binding transcriptional ArsR family regulator
VDALQLVAEPHRQGILRLVWRDELPVGELATRLDLSYSGVSQHLARLREAGFVTVRRDGKQRLYRADRERLGPLPRSADSARDRRGPRSRPLWRPVGSYAESQKVIAV